MADAEAETFRFLALRVGSARTAALPATVDRHWLEPVVATGFLHSATESEWTPHDCGLDLYRTTGVEEVMIRSLSIRTVLLALVAGFCLSFASTTTHAVVGEPERMTKSEARAYYKKHACRVNDAGDRFIRVLWKGKDRVTLAEVRRRLPIFKRESRRFGKAGMVFAGKMYSPPAKWPVGVAYPVKKLANKNVTYAAIRLRQARVSNARQWIRLNGRANNVRFGSLSTKIRAKLELPPPGKGC